MTATHQLKTAVTSVAFAARSLFFSSAKPDDLDLDDDAGDGDTYTDLLMISLSNALLGMDANDPPKTSATMQLIGSIFSNVSISHLIIVIHLSIFLNEYFTFFFMDDCRWLYWVIIEMGFHFCLPSSFQNGSTNFSVAYFHC